LDFTVQTLVTQLGSLDTRIDTKMNDMEHTLISVIADKLAVGSIVTQVADVMGGETSPFVTAASLDLTMTKWFAIVNKRLDGLVNSTIEPEPRPHKKRTSDTLGDVPMPIVDMDDPHAEMDTMDEESILTTADAAQRAAGGQ
jgi:hypothetical protein